eukprot:gnl/MRDRNA2_/MRDRNA2_17142_c0_seq1.p1 gnl/MRDRNA2_/MRDRNA2_17142_c0~~gnl/MRDRNA2_/MRDRNA2_17142_c0_seq1.p1  ORF type:complete len:116 (-),score=36.11 gnl/MRDRNA2_/MRDRNA2_17142_c0_seq1:95-442(-)
MVEIRNFSPSSLKKRKRPSNISCEKGIEQAIAEISSPSRRKRAEQTKFHNVEIAAKQTSDLKTEVNADIEKLGADIALYKSHVANLATNIEALGKVVAKAAGARDAKWKKASGAR